MKMKFRFSISIILIAVLICGVPFVVYASVESAW